MKLHAARAAAQRALPVLSGLVVIMLAGAAFAQPVYRSVDKSGKIVFSDQPPSAGSPAATAPSSGGNAGSDAPLPYELRQVVQRYPVTIYTGDDCGPCGSGRSLLIARGVPFDERTVKTPDDIAALQRLSGQTGLPLLTIGSQQLKGFADADWSQYLDAAGYPTSSQLPSGFRNAAARPLVAQQAAVAPSTGAAPRSAAAADAVPAPSSEPTPSNPAGIKF